MIIIYKVFLIESTFSVWLFIFILLSHLFFLVLIIVFYAILFTQYCLIINFCNWKNRAFIKIFIISFIRREEISHEKVSGSFWVSWVKDSCFVKTLTCCLSKLCHSRFWEVSWDEIKINWVLDVWWLFLRNLSIYFHFIFTRLLILSALNWIWLLREFTSFPKLYWSNGLWRSILLDLRNWRSKSSRSSIWILSGMMRKLNFWIYKRSLLLFKSINFKIIKSRLCIEILLRLHLDSMLFFYGDATSLSILIFLFLLMNFLF